MVTIVKEIDLAVAEYIRWQTERMGRDINPSYLIALLMKTGIKRAEVRSPAFTVIEKDEVPVLRDTNTVNGGIEDP